MFCGQMVGMTSLFLLLLLPATSVQISFTPNKNVTDVTADPGADFIVPSENEQPAPGTMKATITNMLADNSVNVSSDVSDVLETIMNKKLQPRTVQGLLVALHREVPNDQMSHYIKVASKLSGLHQKKHKLMNEMVDTFATTDEEKNAMMTAMRNLSVNSIIQEVKNATEQQSESETPERFSRLNSMISNIDGWGKKKIYHGNHTKPTDDDQGDYELDDSTYLTNEDQNLTQQ